MPLDVERKSYKPFEYPWAYEAWKKQQQIHWLPEEVPLDVDIRDWKSKLNQGEKGLLTHIFRFFTQADIDVNDCYMTKYANVFKPTEVKMMLAAFSNMETVHVAAYSHLIDTIGMPDTTYLEFLEYKEMKDKYEYVRQFSNETPHDTALTMAAFGAFTEGMQLFASFAMLMNFQRFGKMRGMGQIVAWSVRDETLHCNSIIRLYHDYVKENWANIDKPLLEREIYDVCQEMVKHEDAFVDLAFGMAEIEGMTADDVKAYIRHIANRRLDQLQLSKDFQRFEIAENPLPWMDEVLNGLEHTNFFENRSTEYSKGSMQGTWDDAWQTFTDMKEAA